MNDSLVQLSEDQRERVRKAAQRAQVGWAADELERAAVMLAEDQLVREAMGPTLSDDPKGLAGAYREVEVSAMRLMQALLHLRMTGEENRRLENMFQNIVWPALVEESPDLEIRALSFDDEFKTLLEDPLRVAEPNRRTAFEAALKVLAQELQWRAIDAVGQVRPGRKSKVGPVHYCSARAWYQITKLAPTKYADSGPQSAFADYLQVVCQLAQQDFSRHIVKSAIEFCETDGWERPPFRKLP